MIDPEELPEGAKPVDFCWACKKKPSGVYRARLALRGFKQVAGDSYEEDDKAAPVVNGLSIKIILTMIVLANWYTKIVDVESAFLHGYFERPTERLFATIPDGFEPYYPPNWLLEVLKTTYGSKQGAIQWWREICKALYYLGWKRHSIDPCLFIKVTKDGHLIVLLLWVDDVMIAGKREDVISEAAAIGRLFDVTDESPDGKMVEYVGCMIDRTKEYIKMTQPIKIARFKDEFGFNGGGSRPPNTPSKPGSVLAIDAEGDKPATKSEHAQYRTIAGITNHMAQWSRPDILNSQREVSQFLAKPTKKCIEAQGRLTNYIVHTEQLGYTIKPKDAGTWDGKQNFKFVVEGESDSEYAKDPSRRSVNCGCTYLNGSLVKMFSKMMPVVALSTTEAELYSAVQTAMDMMFTYHIVIAMGLTVELPMVLYCDNMGAVHLANNWTIGGRTRHVCVKINYLRELKEQGFIHMKHKSGTLVKADQGTKNLGVVDFWRFIKSFMS